MTEHLQKFFAATAALDDKELEFLGWRGPKGAANTIKKHEIWETKGRSA